MFSDELFNEDTEVLPKLCASGYVLEIDWMKKLSQQELKNPEIVNKKKKCMQKCMVSAVTLNLKKEFQLFVKE